jgi:hypothetical protein
MFLDHLKGLIMKGRYAQGWSFEGAIAGKVHSKAWFALILWKNNVFQARGCSNFLK